MTKDEAWLEIEHAVDDIECHIGEYTLRRPRLAAAVRAYAAACIAEAQQPLVEALERSDGYVRLGKTEQDYMLAEIGQMRAALREALPYLESYGKSYGKRAGINQAARRVAAALADAKGEQP